MSPVSTAVVEGAAPAAPAGLPTLEREDVRFVPARSGIARFEITFRSESETPTLPTPAVIQVAPLGAFVRWTPLHTLFVPSIAPGDETTLAFEVPFQPPPALGTPDRVPPAQLLTALGAGEPNDRKARRRAERARLAGDPAAVALPADPLQLLTHGAAHFAGNLNVFVGTAAVERHVARALRIYPGRTNVALFVVGSGTRDRYTFALDVPHPHWDVRLFDGTHGLSLAFVDRGPEIMPDRPVEVENTGVVMLAVRPPEDCEAGAVAVRVTQRSTGKEAVVEFDLDPRAQGPGCYTV
jgi:hypothetical protein